MILWAILANGVATAVAGAVFLDAGVRIARRQVWSGDLRAVRSFGVWWILYGLLAVLRGVRFTLVSTGQDGIRLFMLIFYTEVAAVFVGLAGLVVYVVYLMRGRYLPVSIAYAGGVLLAGIVALAVAYHDPGTVVVEGFRLNVAFGRPMAAVLRWSLLASLYLPLLVIAGLFFHTGRITTGLQRTRAFRVSGVLALLALADIIDLGPLDLGPVTVLAPVLRLVAAAAVVFAYLTRPV